MDCRRFHRNLEAYLEDGLDFPGRFGIERHAQQCISCGKAMAGAQRLRRMARELDRVKAPANFESSVLNEIGKRKAYGRFSALRRFWLYGLELPSVRRVAVASSCFAVLALGFFYLSPYLSRRAALPSAPSPVAQETAMTAQPVDQEPADTGQLAAQEPATIGKSESPEATVTAAAARLNRPAPPPEIAELAEATQPVMPEPEQFVGHENTESDYVEFQMIGPDNRPVRFRWPNKPHIRYGQNPEEYFIRNVSH